MNAAAKRPVVLSQGSYGPRVGLPAILEVLARHGVAATFFFPGRVAEAHPGAVESVLTAGHEVAHHGYTHRGPGSLSREQQAEEFERGNAALQVFGVTPAGYRAPSWDFGPDTLMLVEQFGFRYSSNFMTDIRPFRHEGTDVIELPVLGLGVAVNSLVTSADRGEPGLPFHVLVRAFADCDTLTDAVYIASKHQRSSSGNYLLAHADGLVVNLETTPGGYEGVTPQLPRRGVLVHTNHFVSPVPGSQDVGHYAMADSLIRLQRIEAHIARNKGPATVHALHAALSDHADFPAGVCCHPSARSADGLRWATVTSVIMDLDERAMYLSEGNPCQYPSEMLSFDGLLDKPSSFAAMRDSVERASVRSSL
jgi:hypothetical protein